MTEPLVLLRRRVVRGLEAASGDGEGRTKAKVGKRPHPISSGFEGSKAVPKAKAVNAGVSVGSFGPEIHV